MKKVKEICRLSRKAYPLLKDYEKDWPVIDILKLHLKYTSEARRRAEVAASVKEVRQVSSKFITVIRTLTIVQGPDMFGFKAVVKGDLVR